MTNPSSSTLANLRSRVRKRKQELDQRFTSIRQNRGYWEDGVRGRGIQISLEAMDTLINAAKIINVPPPYETRHFLKDFALVKEQILGEQDLDRAFPLPSFLEDRRSSPETAALVLSVAHGLRRHLRHTGDWSPKLATDFEEVTDKAFEFLENAFSEPQPGSGGWGIFIGETPQLYFTVATVRALAAFGSNEQIPEAKKKQVKQFLAKAHKYLLSTHDGTYFYNDHDKSERYDTFSAYGLIGLLALYIIEDSPVDFGDEVRPIFNQFSDKIDPKVARRVRYYERDANQYYEDQSGTWDWLQAIMLSLHRRWDFYEDHWEQTAEKLVVHLLESEVPDAVYMWNRATVALTSFEQYAVRYWRVPNYALRKANHQLFKNSKVAKAIYEAIRIELGEEG